MAEPRMAEPRMAEPSQSPAVKAPGAAGIVAEGHDPGYSYPRDPLARAALEHWQDLKFGVIIHWGLYSRLGLDGSWTLCRSNDEEAMLLPCWFTGDEAQWYEFYQKSRERFDAPQLDAAEWARASRVAGAKYLVFTAKHHDGFALYDTSQTDFKVTADDVPLGCDVLAAFFKAYRAEGLETGVYFSKADWAHPGYWNPEHDIVDRFHNYDIPAALGLWDDFREFTRAQIEELLTHYGKVNVLWLDAGWVHAPEEDLDISGIADLAWELQPGILIVDREVHGENEDYRTLEQQIPRGRLDYPWESCITMSEHWTSVCSAEQAKNPRAIIEMLVQVVARGGNLLLGIGPGGNGAMPPSIAAGLEEIGSWIDVNGAALYGSRPVGTERVVGNGGQERIECHGAEWWLTSHQGALHLISLDPPGQRGQELTLRLRERVTDVTVTASREQVSWSQDAGYRVSVTVPGDFGTDNGAVITLHTVP